MDLRFSIFWCMTSQLIVVVYHTHWETYSFAVLSASMCTKVIGRSRGLTKGSQIVLRHGHTIVFGLFYICCIFRFAYLCKGSSEILYTCHCIHFPELSASRSTPFARRALEAKVMIVNSGFKSHFYVSATSI